MKSIGTSHGWWAGALGFALAFGSATAVNAAVTISSAATQNMSCSGGLCSPTAATANLSVSDLTTMLASGNVIVNTGTGSLEQQVEDIIVETSFNWASAKGLKLDAYRSVTVEQPVADNGTGAVTLVTDDGGSGGTLSFISGGSLSFLGTSSVLSINAKTYKLENSISALAAAIKAKPSGFFALSASYNASHDGTYSASPIATNFQGVVNGLGNTISNLAINSAKSGNLGLFASLEANSAVDSVIVTNANFTMKSGRTDATAVGVLVGTNNGSVFNSYASGQINETIGGLGVALGGLVGGNVGTIINSGAATNITSSSKTSKPSIQIGGLVGYSSSPGVIEESYATGTVSVVGNIETYAGGLVSFSDSVIENCYAEGGASSGSGTGQAQVGGLAGVTFTPITTSYSTGTATTGSSGFAGGFVGADASNGGLSNDYWDTTTSGLNFGIGGSNNEPGVTGETTAQLQAGLPAGFDPTIWAESPSINNGLPYLIANPPQ